MSIIPPNMVRVPMGLSARLSLNNITGTNLEMLRLQEQLSSGRAINRPSDDIVKAVTIGVLDDRMERSQQLTRNYSHATAALGTLEAVLREASDLTREARGIASDQINLTASPAERVGQAGVVAQMLRGLFTIANREGVAGYVLGGSTTSQQPVEEFLGFYRFRSEGPGLTTDLDQASSVPITFGQSPVAGLSKRVRGSVSLGPSLAGDTRLADLRGVRGLGIATDELEMQFGTLPRVRVSLSNTDTVQDVVDRLTASIRELEASESITVLGPGGVSFGPAGLRIDVAPPATPPATPADPAPTLTFFDIGDGSTGRDLGLVQSPATAFTSTNTDGLALAPRLTMRSRIDGLTAVTDPLGQIRLENAGRVTIVDLAGSETIEDIKNRIESAGLGLRVSINSEGTGIDVLNDVSAGSAASLSIGEIAGNNSTATMLGIRTFAGATRVSDLNFGRGVQVVHNVPDPITGVPTASLNTDIRIALGDATGTTIDIDLAPTDLSTVDNMLGVINAQIQAGLASAGLAPDSLVARLADDGNGLLLDRSGAPAGTFSQPLRIEARNNSSAAEQLGLLFGTWNDTTQSLQGQDRARVRVDSLFSDLVDLREGLLNNSVQGIGLAGGTLDDTGNLLAESRGLVGSYQQRVSAADTREADRNLLDETTRSQLRDLDFTTAATRLTALQTQLQATLQSTAAVQQLSLLDYL
jgi:flagellar hook-associated protein 3 FlgL